MAEIKLEATFSENISKETKEEILSDFLTEGLEINEKGFLVMKSVDIPEVVMIVVIYLGPKFVDWIISKGFDATWNNIKKGLKKSHKKQLVRNKEIQYRIEIIYENEDVIASIPNLTEPEIEKALTILPENVSRRKLKGWIWYNSKLHVWEDFDDLEQGNTK